MKKPILVLGGLLVLGLATVGAVREFSGGVTTGGDGDWLDYYDAASLIAASELIVVAELQSEATEEIVFASPVDPNVKFVRTELIQTIKVIEVVKGDYSASTIERRTTLGHTYVGTEREGRSSLKAPPIEKGRTYVLFLTQYPVDDTRTGWSAPGDPGLAELQGDRLIFRGTERYGQAVQDRGLPQPSSGSEAPFEMTLTELRSK